MSKNAIEVEGLGKKFYIGSAKQEAELATQLMDIVVGPIRRLGAVLRNRPPEDAETEFWALREVSFEVKAGEVFGVIGRNGAGKSTLLKTLTGISSPTEGLARIYGRVGSLLEVGTGFHPELTGRENVYMNGTLLGMKNDEIRRRFNDIVEFSGIGEFIDTPAKRYSSGMQVRLAFSVAAHLDPEVLLVDEVLSVGDAEFRRRSMGKMREVTGQGRTVLLVSHSIPAILNLCNRVMLLEGGRVSMIGDPQQVVTEYLKRTHVAPSDAAVDLSNHAGRPDGCVPVLRQLRLLDAQGEENNSFLVGQDVVLELTLDSGAEQYQNANVVVLFYDVNDVLIARCPLRQHANETLTVQGRHQVVMRWPECNLAPGEYRIELEFRSRMVQSPLVDAVRRAVSFEMLPSDYYGTGLIPKKSEGLVWVRTQWQTEPLGQLEQEG